MSIKEEIKNIKSGCRELRQFGITISAVLGILGGLFVLRHKGYYLYFFIFSAAFLFFGLFLPVLLKPIQKIWMSLAVFIGWLLTKLILIVLFYFVLTPIAILARLCGKEFLDTEFDSSANSYWISKEAAKFDKRSCENQF